MIITNAAYLSSVVHVADCPEPDKPEYAFIGRSNVGKSSLINVLVNKKNLAKTSGTPGKTKTINHFIVHTTTQTWYMVDLPGYGYAKTSLSERKKWEKFIRDYLVKRENLLCTFVLVDSRHAPQSNDLDFMLWLAAHQLPFAIIFTKWDKLSLSSQEKNIRIYQQKMLAHWEEMPNCFFTSAARQWGRDTLLDFIEKTNLSY